MWRISAFLGTATLLTVTAACGSDPSSPGQRRSAGTFTFRPEQVIDLPYIVGPTSILSGDVNGDGRLDLVFNPRPFNPPSVNRWHVALGQANGTFALQPPVDHPTSRAEGWPQGGVLVLDANGDGRDDLLWNITGDDNIVFLALSTSAGWMFRPPQVHTNHVWQGYGNRSGDMNDDGREDIVWARESQALTRFYFGLAQDNGTFSMISNYVDYMGDYRGHQIGIGHFNADPYGDVILSRVTGGSGGFSVGAFRPNDETSGTLTWTAHQRELAPLSTSWFLIGDMDGRDGDDLIWVVFERDMNVQVHTSINAGDATFMHRNPQEAAIAGPVDAFRGDFNRDGRADLLLIRREGPDNQLLVGIGRSDGTFELGETQSHPDRHGEWEYFWRTFIGDVNGDGKDDVVWVHSNRVFVALAN